MYDENYQFLKKIVKKAFNKKLHKKTRPESLVFSFF